MNGQCAPMRRPVWAVLACAASAIACVFASWMGATNTAYAQIDAEAVIAAFLKPDGRGAVEFAALCGQEPDTARQAFRDYVDNHANIAWLFHPYSIYGTVKEHLGEADARIVATQVFLAMSVRDGNLNRWANFAAGLPKPSWTGVYELRLVTEDPAKQDFLTGMSWAVAPTSTEELAGVHPTTPKGFALRSEGFLILATALQRKRDAEGAQECCLSALADAERALEMDADSLDALYAMGLASSSSGQHETALGYFDEIIRRAPEFVRAYQRRAGVHRRLGHEVEAQADEAKVLELQTAATEAWLRSPEGLSQQVGVARGHANLAVTSHAKREDTIDYRSEALRAFENILKHHGDLDVYYLRRAMFRDYFGEEDEALQDLDAFLTSSPDAAYGYLLRARLHRRRGDEQAAEADTQRYRECMAGRVPLTVPLPEPPAQPPTTDLNYFDLQELGERAQPADVLRIAQVIAASNADGATRLQATKMLEAQSDDEALLPAVPYLELALQLDLPDGGLRGSVIQLLARLKAPGGAGFLTELARDASKFDERSTSRIVDAIAEYPPDVAIPHLTYLVLNAAADSTRGLAARRLNGLADWPYGDATATLIILGTRDEQVAAASLYRGDVLGRLTLLELASDPDTDMVLRQRAWQCLTEADDPLAREVALEVDR